MVKTQASNLFRIVGFVDKECSFCRGMDSEFLPYNFDVHVQASSKEKAIYTFLKHYPDLTFTDIVCYQLDFCIYSKDVDKFSKSEILSVVKPFINPQLM